MSTIRHQTNQKDWHRGTGPNGRQLCRWCGTETEPPRRTWCSQACVDQYMVRNSSSGARAVIHRRDNGICALCGCDTELLKRVLRRFAGAFRVTTNAHNSLPEVEALTRHLGFIPHRSFWEADHITPVIEGGGQCGPENFRTLCRPCHVRATAELAAKRAKERRDAKRPLLVGADEPQEAAG